jgi:putative hemolysin
MSLHVHLENFFEAESRRAHAKHRLRVGLAVTTDDVRAAQHLRHMVFVEEMGARLHEDEPGIECDRFDDYCQHLLVRDATNDQVVGCYRILTDSQAALAGGFYSQTEFDLTRVLAVPGRFVEVGRTCIHPDYRTGAVISLLWSGLARFMLMQQYEYLMGCASIPLGETPDAAFAQYQQIAAQHLSPPEWRVFPKTPLPLRMSGPAQAESMEIPPLIKGYLRMGAQVCGEPAWDPVFNVADLFVLLSLDRLSARYAQHFIRRG